MKLDHQTPKISVNIFYLIKPPPKRNPSHLCWCMFFHQGSPPSFLSFTRVDGQQLLSWGKDAMIRTHAEKHGLVSGWWFQPTPSEKYYIVKICDVLPQIFGVKIPNMFELPPPVSWSGICRNSLEQTSNGSFFSVVIPFKSTWEYLAIFGTFFSIPGNVAPFRIVTWSNLK